MANALDGRTSHPSRTLALLFGVVYLLVGIVGFVITGFDNFAKPAHETLLVFHINPLHNVAHLLVGLLGVVMWRRLDTARAYGWLLAVAYAGLVVLGLVVGDKDTSANFLDINMADNGLHAATAIVGLLIALWPVRTGTATGDRA